MSVHKDISLSELKEKLGIADVKTYGDFKDFKKLFMNRAIAKVVQATEFSTIEMEIIERRLRKASKVRISYEYEGQKQDFGNSGFLLGQEKNGRQSKEPKDQVKPSQKKRSPTRASH